MTKLYKYTDNSAHNLSDLPPQAAAIVEEIKSKGVIRRDDLLESLEERFKKYTQSPHHVLSFYRGRLIREGFMIEITA
jgi:hypothetical protein